MYIRSLFRRPGGDTPCETVNPDDRSLKSEQQFVELDEKGEGLLRAPDTGGAAAGGVRVALLRGLSLFCIAARVLDIWIVFDF